MMRQNPFDCLTQLLKHLGLTISQEKLIPSTTSAACLDSLINAEEGTISIPGDKLAQNRCTVSEWLTKSHCTKKQRKNYSHC